MKIVVAFWHPKKHQNSVYAMNKLLYALFGTHYSISLQYFKIDPANSNSADGLTVDLLGQPSVEV